MSEKSKKTALLFEMSTPGRIGYSLPALDVPVQPLEDLIAADLLRTNPPALPELSEVDVVRHFTQLSQRNYGVDSGFYPLGSCTMKYNPKINEDVARLSGFSRLHPHQPEEHVQGALELMYSLDKYLAEITGMARVSLAPAAGAHGEMTGLMIIKSYHHHRGDYKRKKIVIPDAAHGTNPATVTVAGFEVLQVGSNERGGVDVAALKALMSDEIAGLMLTNPNTLGLFEENIVEIAEIIHSAGEIGRASCRERV